MFGQKEINNMFSKLPTWWVRAGLLAQFRSKNLGESIAALKCYLALALTMDFHSHKIKISTYDLETMTSLSRPMVNKGLDKLIAMNLISVDKSNHTHLYTLTSCLVDFRWAKIPTHNLKKALKEMSNNRSKTTLVALKIYIYMLSIRPNDEYSVGVSHDTIRTKTYIQTDQVRPGIDVLINYGLISVSKKPNTENKNLYEGSNYYNFRGLKLKRS